MIAWVTGDDIYPAGKTDYELAFKTAMKSIEDSQRARRSTKCNSVILFMSDGDITQGKKGQDLLAEVRTLNHGDLGAKIFTFAIGDSVKDPVLKQLACQHNGIWWRVPDGGNLGDKMASYLKYFAATVSVDRVKWHQYKFFSTGQMGISGCLPVYDNSKPMRTLFGVTCVDMNLYTDMNEVEKKPDWPLFQKKMKADTETCPTLPSKET